MRAADYVTGSVEVRQLRSVYKLSFTDIVRVNRFKPDGAQVVEAVSDEGSDESAIALRRAEREQSGSVRLHVFLTKKRAKTRMADLEETAFLLRLDVGQEGCICFGKSFGNFDQVRVEIHAREQHWYCGAWCGIHPAYGRLRRRPARCYVLKEGNPILMWKSNTDVNFSSRRMLRNFSTCASESIHSGTAFIAVSCARVTGCEV